MALCPSTMPSRETMGSGAPTTASMRSTRQAPISPPVKATGRITRSSLSGGRATASTSWVPGTCVSRHRLGVGLRSGGHSGAALARRVRSVSDVLSGANAMPEVGPDPDQSSLRVRDDPQPSVARSRAVLRRPPALSSASSSCRRAGAGSRRHLRRPRSAVLVSERVSPAPLAEPVSRVEQFV